MRTRWIATLAALAFVPLFSVQGCGSSSQADALFGPAPSTPAAGGSGAGASDAGTGGSSGTSATGGSGQSGGVGGVPTGGYAGSMPSGGYAGSMPSGGYGGIGGSPQTGGTGGGPAPLGEVPCPSAPPSDSCPVPDQVCCLTFADNENGTCVQGTQAGACETHIECSAPSNCPLNMICCGHLVSWSGTSRYDQVRCQTSCSAPDDVVFCDPYDNTISCATNEYCGPSQILPNGYNVCQQQ